MDPGNCDVCLAILGNAFVDGKTHMGPWAVMCDTCHRRHGTGIGTGKGQRYARVSAGEHWKKVVG